MSDVSNTYRISCARDQFSKLLTMLEIFQNYCTDCDIRKGIFRCKTNDRHAIVEMNLSSILQENDLSFSVIKNKVACLKTFELDDNVQADDKNIWIESNESNYEFNDFISKQVFRKPAQKYLDNKFIDQETFGSMIRIREENLILSTDISSYMKKRIANIALAYENDSIECNMSGLTADLKIIAGNKQDVCTPIKNIPLNKEIQDKKFRMITMPFVLDIMSDIKMYCYSVSADVCLCKFDTTYYGVSISIYTQVKLTSLGE